MLVLFPNDTLEPQKPERDYEFEVVAARAAGFEVQIVDFDALRRGEERRAVRFLTTSAEEQTALYRGWMLRPDEYATLHQLLKEKNRVLINSPENYRICHYLPEIYPFIKGRTPRSVWFPLEGEPNFTEIHQELNSFGDVPLVVKDYVKSQKHFWHEACFIPSALDHDTVERVTRRFIELQEPFLNEGLVYREFVPLQNVGTHPTSLMPLAAEWRLFVFDGKVVLCAPTWDAGDYSDLQPVIESFLLLLARIPSRFWSLDIALAQSGEWLIVETGDGQVSGLSRENLAEEFYSNLAKAMSP